MQKTESLQIQSISELQAGDASSAGPEFKSVFDELILSLDANADITLLNEGGHRMLGYEPGELLGENWFKTCIPTEARAEVENTFEQIVSGNLDGYLTYENEVLRKDGEKLLLSWRNEVIKNKDGEVTGTLSSARDISERDFDRIALMRERALSQALLDAMPDAMVYTDTNRVVVGTNTAFEDIFGFDMKDLEGQKTSFFYESKDEFERQGRIRYNLNANEQALPYEAHYRRKDGSIFTGETAGTSIRDVSGTIIGFIGVIRDVTRRKKEEVELARSRQLLEASQAIARVGGWELDIKTGELYWTDETYRIHETSPEEFTPTVDAGVGYFLPESRRIISEALDVAIQRGEGYDLELETYTTKGSLIHVRTTCEVTKKDGQPVRLTGTFQDITKQKMAEKELEEYRNHLEQLVEERTAQLTDAQRQAETASIAKTAFLANMSHEIRTPMNAIIGLTHLMQNADPRPEQKERLGSINSAAEHLLSVINNILDVSKIEAGKLVLEREEFSLAKVFENVRSILEERARSKSIDLVLEVGEAPNRLLGDATRLRQCLLNFTENAIKFTDHGSVEVMASLLEKDEDSAVLHFAVKDTGMGVPKDKLPELFQPFEQGDVSTSRKFGGTGLGLVVSRHLANLMGGDAGAESVPGEGSTFWFTARLGLSPDSNPDDAMTSTEEQLPDFTGKRILLVEDNAINLVVATALLERLKACIDTAEDGSKAIERVARSGYDLILMDVQMPNIDGLEATRIIRAMLGQMKDRDIKFSDVPIVAMTANAYEEDRRSCFRAGMNDFIAKPVVPDKLYEMVSKWLSGTKS